MYEYFDYSDFSKRWRFRHPIKCSEVSSTKDFLITIPSEWDDFWNSVDEDGRSVRFVTDTAFLVYSDYFRYNGIDIGAKYEIISFDYAARTATYRVEKTSGSFTESHVSSMIIWIFWDSLDLGVGTSSFVDSVSTISTEIYYGAIGTNVFDVTIDQTGLPVRRIQKNVDEFVTVWFNAGQYQQNGAIKQFSADGPLCIPTILSVVGVTDYLGAPTTVFDDCFSDYGRVAFVDNRLYYGVYLNGANTGDQKYLIEFTLQYNFRSANIYSSVFTPPTDAYQGGTRFLTKFYLGVDVTDY